ncbi:hypothetical protein [Oscillatoria sp. CS-180]|uniref:hypothetical protein n=1 Tax=Oscillatoria sp. CS-180 TaxID=3021720 RepID=UPI002330DEBC|nr:hypothetical protein [Oscillatoria sp. CS-180]
MRDILQERLDELDITKYELTRRVVELRKQDGQDTTISKLSSAVTKALEEPDGRRYSAIAELVEAMDGELLVRWKDYKEVKVQ